MSFSSLYVGATGVVAHGDRMQVVANNLANINTVGYKKGDAQFADLISKQMASGSARYQSGANQISQIGMGVAIGEVRTLFNEGGIENTNTVTDLAIAGNGFFGVRNPNGTGSTGASHYTRAGNFRFNTDAYLVDPHDFRLQGYQVDRETGQVSTTVSDVQLPYEDITIGGVETRVVQSAPRATTGIEMITNLDALATDHYTSSTDPFFGMLAAYNGSLSNSAIPFEEGLPAYSSSLNVYDSDGNKQDLTVYFDPVSTTDISNAAAGHSYWEYLIAMPGASDGSSAYGTSSAGLAGVGVMTFNGLGELVDHTAFSLNAASGAGGKSLGSWTPSTFALDGTPQFSYTFGSNGAAVGDTQSVAMNFGLTSASSSWLSGAGTAAGVGLNASNLPGLAETEKGLRSTTSYDSGSATLFQNQDGYTSGYLLNTSVDREGFLNGIFTNGQTEQLYQISMYRFTSEWGLNRAGNNNFLATDASGTAIAGVAEDRGRGTMQQNSLEMSNVDMAEEFANMILTQRGYQANTKVITTSNTLLNTTISIKR